jgi:elongation of very long chain fatty acids protein 4|eukprot:CAMPEP_0169132592 /NCGR_PEP_ID=MMETSP1015-20121227/38862_1 /TAXON_ID=342587 /ORGANISM="Karlodinium micrum, Strain CCMP2283" /LENGTH=314 /DNA_ID=CAMNT_0009196929 /DNA_START=50 /DNA_END=994 /DNA_ORIENTATION=+
MNAMWSKLDSDIVGFFNPLAKDPAVRAPVRNGWPLQRLDHAVAIAALYLVFVIGCKLMSKKGGAASEKKKSASTKAKVSVAEKIKQDGIVVFVAMAIYNATQVALCGWMVYAALVEHRKQGFSLVCNRHDLAEDGMAFVNHIFYLSKVLDFADTVFMIVKGNWHQVSFLHVYHHTSIFLVYWLNAQANYASDIYLTIVLNGTIHFIMYGYYFATAFNVTVPSIIKKSITKLQLFQFCCMELQGLVLLLGSCDSPRNITILYMVYISTMMILFLDFFFKSYSSGKSSKSAKSASASKSTGDESTVASESDKIKGA